MTKDAIKPISTHREVLQQVLEALNLPSMKTQQMLIQRDEAIDALRDMLSREHALYELARLGQELQPESCQTCVEIHSLLDADESMIIKNARDGYPEGRTPRELTLLERVKSLCKYAADWKRWCIEAQTPPAAQPEPLGWAVEGCSKMWRGEYAELDAKAEARRIGGTCFAYALYTRPRPRLQEETQCKWPTCQNEEYQNAMAEQLKQELVTGRQWVGLTEVQRDDFADAHGSYQAVCAIEQALKERNNG